VVRKFLIITILSFFALNSFAQRFSHYFTNTLYESFENPAQSAFTPDTSRMVAFNFFVPNFTANASLSGHSQNAVKQYLFVTNPSVENVVIGKALPNNAYANASVYVFMLKLFTSLDGNQEIGLSEQIRGEAKARFTDETVALFDANRYFPNTSYTDLFNDKYKYQTYHQVSLTYRKTINPELSWGIKLSALSGIAYQENRINYSNVTFNNAKQLSMTFQGQQRMNFDPGKFSVHDNIFPSFRDPGASISIGITQKNEDGFRFQYNLKDVGFIHWSKYSNVYNYNNTGVVNNYNSNEDQVYHVANAIFQKNPTKQSFTTATDGRFEVSATTSYWLNYDRTYQYSPVAVVSKQLFDRGLAAALMHNFQYKNLMVGITTTYNEMRQFYLGGQLMVRSPNAEFFIGCEQIYPAYNFAQSATGSANAILKTMPYSAAGLFMGFSVKLGSVIESHPNASYIRQGEGFFYRLTHAIF
jgi:hypothetical protein